MAMIKTIKMQNGLAVKGAYVRIISAGTDKIWANIRVGFFVTKNNEVPFYEHEYVFTPNMTDEGANLWKQGYEYLKNHPDFAGAEDILEDGQQA